MACFFQLLRLDYGSCLQRLLLGEVKNWHDVNMPEVDADGCYVTEAPLLVFEMISQHLDVAKTIR